MASPGITKFLASGKFWMWFWLSVIAVAVVWGVLTFAFWMDSVRNLNALSIAALWVAAGAGCQATLSMRKADDRDPL